MSEIIILAKEFGPWVAITITLISVMIWLLKFLVKDLAKTLKDLDRELTIHAAVCEQGQKKGCERGRDVDAIGKSVEKLVNILTMTRRPDDADGKKPIA